MRATPEDILDEVQDAAEVVDVRRHLSAAVGRKSARNVTLKAAGAVNVVSRDHKQRHTEAVHIVLARKIGIAGAGSIGTGGAIKGQNVVVEPSPVVPSYQDYSVVPVTGVTVGGIAGSVALDGTDNVRNPVRALVTLLGMIRPVPIGDYPAHVLQFARRGTGKVRKYLGGIVRHNVTCEIGALALSAV